MDKLILFSSCLLAVISDMLLVFYAKSSSHKIVYLITAIMLSITGILIWTYSMKKGIEAAMAITIYSLFTVIGCTVIGVFVFGEHLSPLNIVGIILGLIALIIISI